MSPLYLRWLICSIYAMLFGQLLPETGDTFDWHHVSNQATEEQFWPHCLWLFVSTGKEHSPSLPPSLPVSWFQSKHGFQYNLVCKLGGPKTHSNQISGHQSPEQTSKTDVFILLPLREVNWQYRWVLGLQNVF